MPSVNFRSPFVGEARALGELAAFGAALPWFSFLPRGDGHPVMVLPGFAGDDSSTAALRGVIGGLGYDVTGWGLGRNRGGGHDVQQALEARLEERSRRRSAPVSLVGWSLGGVFARNLARRQPELVRQVITMGSPFRRLERKRDGEGLAVPCTAVYSRSDPIVHWQDAMEDDGPRSESVEVQGSHLGLGHNPAVVLVVADRLARRPGSWRPFRPPLGAHHLFPDPRRPSRASAHQ
jgi:pimeloyl-ACP methyl ester carboxylesterase